MRKRINFGPIDNLRDPQKIVSATFDNKYVKFLKSDKPPDEPEIIATLNCVKDLLQWVDDESSKKVYGFKCEIDKNTNVVGGYLAHRHVVLDFVDQNRVAHHTFFSIASLRRLVNELDKK